MTDHLDLIRRLAITGDNCLDHLRKEAERERRREEGKPMRSISAKGRFELADAAVTEAFDLLRMNGRR